MAREGMSVAGIVQDPETQSRVIPESRRADGSIRKERKVKPGFTPAEDISRFRPSRVLEAQQRNSRSIPGYEPTPLEAARKAMARSTLASASSPSRADGEWRRVPSSVSTATREAAVSSSSSRSKASTSSTAAASSANWRRKEVASEEIPDDWEKEEIDKGESSIAAPSSALDVRKPSEANLSPEKSVKSTLSPADDKVAIEEEADKKAKALKKKVRAAQALQDKYKQNGDVLLPEQQAKVDSLDDMIRDLQALEVKDGKGQTTK